MMLRTFSGRRFDEHRVFIVSFGLLVSLAWAVLWIWGESPYGRFLDHDEVSDLILEGDLLLMPIFVSGWVLMTVAMMLPTTLPLITIFRGLVRRRPNREHFVLLLLVGYLGVWIAFGVLAHLGDLVLHEVTEQSVWLETNAWVIGGAILLIAGLYQFTPLKHFCLDKCRSPMSFIMTHWQGRREHVQSLKLGVHHGLYCLGCCWSLMLLMFVVGVGNLGWMFILGAMMAIEKNFSWGRRLSTPLGVALLGSGLIVAVGGSGWLM